MAATDKFIKTANATLTSLDSPGKPIGATSMNLVSATNWPTDTGVIFAMRKVDASLVSTSNPSGTVPNSYTEWAAQLSGVTLSSLTLVYGTDQDYSEGLGTQVYIPLSGTWAQRLIDGILLQHKQTGAHKDITADSIAIAGNATVTGTNQDRGVNLETMRSELVTNHIASGCVVSQTSGLGWSLSAGVIYISGRRLTVASATGTVNASKDTYFDLHDNGDGTAVLVNTGGNIVNNGAAAPALAANSIRAALVTSNATDIVLPIIRYGADSLNDSIYPASPYGNNGFLEYAGSSTIVGWSSFTTKSIRYLVNGSLVHIMYALDGTSNSSVASFTLPFPARSLNAAAVEVSTGLVTNNGVIDTPGRLFINPAVDSRLASVLRQGGTGTWAASGTKQLRGQFFYELQRS